MIIEVIEDYTLHLLISVLLFCVPLRHKKPFIGRLVISTIAYVLFGAGIIFYIIRVAAGGIINTFLGYCSILTVLVVAYIYTIVICDVGVWDSLVVVANAYATQNFIYDVTKLIDIQDNQVIKIVLVIIIQIVCYFLFYNLIAKKISDDGRYDSRPAEAIAYFAVVLSVALILSSITARYEEMTDIGYAFFVMRIYGAACCLFILVWNMFMRRRFTVQRQLDNQMLLWEQQKKQLNFSRGSIELINSKLHDLKHQLENAENSDDPEVIRKSIHNAKELITLYNSTQQTGNPILDTILTEMSMRCEKERVNWSCIADGKSFDAMESTDLYSIVHGLLEIAIDLSVAVEAKERRVLSVTTFVKNQLTIFQCESYYQGTVDKEKELSYIENIIEKYNGSLSVDTSNNIFMCTLVIPFEQKM